MIKDILKTIILFVITILLIGVMPMATDTVIMATQIGVILVFGLLTKLQFELIFEKEEE